MAGSVALALLMARDFTAHTENPYRSLITFFGLPALIFLGLILFLIAIRIQVVAARRRGEQVHFALRIEPTDPRYMRNLWLFLGLSVFGILSVGFIGFKGYEATESVAFCGETCHEVMEPEFVTHQNSPHARVECVECHIGPGASYFVKSKIDGLRQVWAVTFDTFGRPLEGPFQLRPARETCEECHWPESFFGSKVTTATYYSLDEENSPWSIVLLLDIGKESRTADPSGIHWHMLTENVVEYIATDAERQEIPWVRVTRTDGSIGLYTKPGQFIPQLNDPDVEIRNFDCLDCHNRPSHIFEQPSDAINVAMASGRLASDLPHLKRAALTLLLDDYADRDTAHREIDQGLMVYYQRSDPDVATHRAGEIQAAAQALVDIYDSNFFPEMKTDFRARVNNSGHRSSPGCFRCHDGTMSDAAGNTITNDCNSCHVILGLGEGANPEALETNLTGVEFEHLGTIGDQWKTRLCSDCHANFQGF